MHSLCFNFYIAHYFVNRGSIPEAWAFGVYVGAALWVAWIGFSRVYMGMHTPVDIGGGALIGLMVLSSYLSVDGEQHDAILVSISAAHSRSKGFTALTYSMYQICCTP